VASVFVSRWDGAVAKTAPAELVNTLGIAMGQRIYRAYHDLMASKRWQRINNEGAHGQRLLWASTGTKDPKASDIMYIKALASPFTVNTMPENTLNAFGDHGEVGDVMPTDGIAGEETLAAFARAGIDIGALATKLQDDGAESFVASWHELMTGIDAKTAAAKAAA
jgi:transaldolase